MSFPDRIVRDPAICDGQPVIRGTRVLVRAVLGYLARGETSEVILREFPSLTEEDVRAVIIFAAASGSESSTASLAFREPQKKGGILTALRRSPLVGVGTPSDRPFEPGRKVDL